MSTTFDAIIVGARIAGSTAAFALAQRGWRVALVERETQPLGETLSLPLVHPRGLVRFQELGLTPFIEEIRPQMHPIYTYQMIFTKNLSIRSAAPPFGGFDYSVPLRREVFDDALLKYVLNAHPQSISLFEGAHVKQLLRNEKTNQICGVTIKTANTSIQLNAPLIIGADGRFSTVARLVQANSYHTRSSKTTYFYSYCTGINMNECADANFHSAADNRTLFFAEMGNGLQGISVWIPVSQFDQFRKHPEDELRATWLRTPELAERMQQVQFVGKVKGLSPQAAQGYFRPAGGPGWALIGDARHFKDPASGQGIHDALYSVQQLIAAINATTAGQPLTSQDAWQRWSQSITKIQRHSDRTLLPMYNYSYTFADSLTRPPRRVEHMLIRAIVENPVLTKRFLGIFTGATTVEDFTRSVPLYLLQGLLAGSATTK